MDIGIFFHTLYRYFRDDDDGDDDDFDDDKILPSLFRIFPQFVQVLSKGSRGRVSVVNQLEYHQCENPGCHKRVNPNAVRKGPYYATVSTCPVNHQHARKRPPFGRWFRHRNFKLAASDNLNPNVDKPCLKDPSLICLSRIVSSSIDDDLRERLLRQISPPLSASFSVCDDSAMWGMGHLVRRGTKMWWWLTNHVVRYKTTSRFVPTYPSHTAFKSEPRTSRG